MDDSAFKAKYHKYKYKVKLWEKEFKEKNRRIPSKHDIREAPKEIRESYKLYYKLKTSFLEETLSEALEDDAFDLSILENSAQNDSFNLSTPDLSALTNDNVVNVPKQNSAMTIESCSSFQTLPATDSSLASLSNYDIQYITDFEAEKIDDLNEKAWQIEVVKKNNEENNTGYLKASNTVRSRRSISEKLFRNASFSKRNPRKSVSRTNLITSQSSQHNLSDMQTETLPDLETILMQKAKECDTITEIPIEKELLASTKSNVSKTLDLEWLNRCNRSNNMETNYETSSSDTQKSDHEQLFGISNINMQLLKSTEVTATISSVDKKSMLTFGMDNMNLKLNTNSHHLKEEEKEEIANSEEENEQSEKIEIRSIRKVTSKRKYSEMRTDLVSKIDTIERSNIPEQSKEKTLKNTTQVGQRESKTLTDDPFVIKNAINKNKSLNENGDTTDEITVEEPKNERKKKIAKSKRKTTSNMKKPRIVRKSSRLLRSVSKTSGTPVLDDDENKIEDETPDSYLMEFGIDKIQNVPRINNNELLITAEKFTEYMKNVIPHNIQNANPKNMSKLQNKTSNLAKTKLEEKVMSGKVNENFVRLNLRKKAFARGKKVFNFSRYKKQLWRNKNDALALAGPDMDMRGCDGGFLHCFQCGKPGHMAQNCKIQSDRLLPINADIEESEFPTLKEAEEMSKQRAASVNIGREQPETNNPIYCSDNNELGENNFQISNEIRSTSLQSLQYIGHHIPKDFLEKAGLLNNETSTEAKKGPIYSLNEDGTMRSTPNEVYETLKLFGYNKFRPGQEVAVMRILSGLSTLVTLSTGSGKSLCYQLPAYLYSKKMNCITLVISPLVSLMEDQVHGVPHFLNAQCLHTNQSKLKRDSIIEMVKAGNVHVLLISPEAIVSGEKSTGFGSILRDLPPIAFVCIDEAHCVSQWSHNFRTSYLMVCRVLHEKLKVKTVLGLTATATLSTRESIVRHLMIPDGLSGVISDIPLPDNLLLTISNEENKDAAMIRLLKSKRFSAFNSIIIYCSRRDECERVAKNLRTIFQDNIAAELSMRNTNGKRKRTLKTTIEPYHAGMPASRRRTIQNNFMAGNLKIVVATIAFGMGINKSDIRSVIHYNMPMNFESYVQEVGRAGRDGEFSHCHLFLDPKGADRLELRRHIYANSIDRHIIRKLLRKIFIPCACKSRFKESSDLQSDIDCAKNMNWNEDFSTETTFLRACPGHEVCFGVDETVNELDIPEENISTLLCYLELHEQRYVKNLSKAYTKCKVLSYGGPKALKSAAANCPPLAMAIALDLKEGVSHETSTFIEFAVINIASAMGWNSGVVKFHLKNLEWTKVDGQTKRSNLSIEFFEIGFRVLAPGDLTDTELDSTLDLLYSRVEGQEKNQLIQLENVFQGLSSVAVPECLISAQTDLKDDRSEKLKTIIRNYFQSNDKAGINNIEDILTQNSDDSLNDDQIISDIRTMISRYPDNNFTGRSLARIFHGVQSPVYPALIWSRCKHWRTHIKTDFNHIVKLANKEILRIRT